MQFWISLALALTLLTLPARAGDVFSPDRWLRHVEEDLLPFWAHPDALGESPGLFPSMRCNDGRVFDPDSPCPEIANWPWMKPHRHYVVALSRQVYSYGVAFHMTGEVRYLDHMRQGMALLMGPARLPDGRGHYEFYDAETESWGFDGSGLDLQKQSYALLGPAFYFYLTRERAVLDMILETHAAMKADYKTSPKLVAYLDQINTFYALLTPLLDDADRAGWDREMRTIAREMVERFYAPDHNVFLTNLETQDASAPIPPAVDFGHTIKTFWFLQMIGALTGDRDLVDTSTDRGRRVLATAQDPVTGAWRTGYDGQGTLIPDLSWWIYAEHSQFAASLALSDPSVRASLRDAHAFWLRDFIDHDHGGSFTRLYASNPPGARREAKHWVWKAGFHEFEHALVAYITGSGLSGEPIDLHYAFETPPDYLHPYFYRAESAVAADPVATSQGPVTRVTFSGISFAE
ncbi:MAG: hypothetical protein AAGE80_15550 [Pseudomonadota bacterium]